MAHFRKQIRDGLKARIETAIQDVPVHSGRTVPYRDTELPAINVLPIGDAVSDDRKNVERLERETDVAVAILVSGRQAEAMDKADDLAERLELALTPSREWSLPVRRWNLLGCDVAPEAGADGMIVALTYRYSAAVLHPAGRPGEPHNFRNPTGA